jgi:hypothetical protein
MVLKDNETIEYTLEAGTRGVTADITRDAASKYNVIWGRGVGPDGYSWRGTVYPDFLLDFEFDIDDLSLMDAPHRYPLVFDPKVDDGSLNPTGIPAVEYNPLVERIDVEINYPPNVTKAAAIIDAGRSLFRDENTGAMGTVTLRTDPAEGSRFLIPVGTNLSYRNFRGGDYITDFEPFLFRIAAIRVDLPNGEVQLTVDSRQRDAMTLSSIIARDRDASVDPAKRPGNVNRRSRQEPDIAVEFDGEAGGHIIAAHSLTGGSWKVFPRPLSQINRIVKIDYTCTERFALVLFGAPVDETFCFTYIGNPLAMEDPLAPNIETLEAAGLIEGWGRLDDACGYFPSQESAGASFTGRFVDTNTIEYNSVRGSWVWVCEYAENDATISGFIYPAANT